MNIENYLDQQYMPSDIVSNAIKCIKEKRQENGMSSLSYVDVLNLGMMMGIRKERMLKNTCLKDIQCLCGKSGKIYKVSTDDLESLGINQGDFVICQHGLKPCQPMLDFVLYRKKDNNVRMYTYYGCYGGSHWAICPLIGEHERRKVDFIGHDCIGVVSHIFSPDGTLKWFCETQNYSEEFDNTKTIMKEPPNVGAFAKSNITDIYDVL